MMIIEELLNRYPNINCHIPCFDDHSFQKLNNPFVKSQVIDPEFWQKTQIWYPLFSGVQFDSFLPTQLVEIDLICFPIDLTDYVNIKELNSFLVSKRLNIFST
jgi:hypothetical protein